MQNAAGGETSVPSDDRNDGRHAIVSDLASLIERVQASMEPIGSTITGESPLGNQESATNVAAAAGAHAPISES